MKSVRVDDVSASGDVAGMCFGSCCESWSVSSSKKVSTVCGYYLWRGSPGAEFGVLKRIFEFLGCFGCQFQDWMILA